MAGCYGLRLVFEKIHCILYDEFIVQTEKTFFSVPRSDDLQVCFAHVYLTKKEVACEESERDEEEEISTFVSNWGGNMRVLRRFTVAHCRKIDGPGQQMYP
jgi:hypothetical protein